jgi:hypothetical protein
MICRLPAFIQRVGFIIFHSLSSRLTPYQLETGLGLAFLASYLLQSCCNAGNKVWKKWI